MQLVHEPETKIIYIISGKYALTIYKILKKHDACQGDDLGDIMIKEFDGTYYNVNTLSSNRQREGERLVDFTMNDNGNIEITLADYNLGKEFPLFLLWKFPDIDIKIFSITNSDVWWWNCLESTVITNDSKGAKDMGLDNESYYANLVSRFEKEFPESIRNNQGEWQIRTQWDDEGNATWVPLKEHFKYYYNTIKLERPTKAPVPQPLLNSQDINSAESQMYESDTDFDLLFD